MSRMAGARLTEFLAYITPDGIEYPLDARNLRFLVSPVTGLGIPSMSLDTQRGGLQHGYTLLNYRLDPRVIQFVVREQGKNRQDRQDIRDEIIDIFRPNRWSVWDVIELGQLKKILPDGSVRYLDVFADATPFEPVAPLDWDEWSVVTPFRLIAPDPTWYDPTAVTVAFVPDPPTDELAFPITFPIVFASSPVLDSNLVISYEGTWATYPTITITGPVTNPKITNVTTGEYIELDYTVSSGETVTITLGFGEKTVENQSGDNLIGSVTPESDLATFHIAPDPEAADGDNTINAYGSSADLSTVLSVSYNLRDVGI